MKDVIRRGVDQQVAEGMFERAQERMQHQFQQLKVFYIQSLNSSPEEPPGGGGEAGTEDGRTSSHLGPNRARCLLQSGPNQCPRYWERRQLALSILPSLPP